MKRHHHSNRQNPFLGVFLALVAVACVGAGMLYWCNQVQNEKVQKVMSRIESAKTAVSVEQTGKDYDAQLKALREDMKERQKTLPVEEMMATPTPASAASKIVGTDDRLQKYRETYKALQKPETDEYKDLPPQVARALSRLDVEKQVALDKVRGDEAAESRVRLEYLGKALDIKKEAR